MGAVPAKNIAITAFDGLKLIATVIKNKNNKPFVLFCHQEEMNKFEFSGIAEKFNSLGFNTIALDLRFGGALGKELSETYENAIGNNKSLDLVHAIKDISSAIDFIYKKYKQKVVLFGSGISASLVLHTASRHKKVAAVIAFSPKELYEEKLDDLQERCAKINVPAFVTGENSKNDERTDLLINLMHEQFLHFEPASEGMYGAQILWKYKPDGEEFWDALLLFVERLKEMRFYYK